MQNADEETLRAIHRLNSQRDWETVLDWLRDSRDKLREESDTNTGGLSELRKSQGKRQALTAILKTAQDANDVLKRIEDSKKKRKII